MTATAPPGCPKHMVFGPCGGVTATGGCELDARPCPFATSPVLDLDTSVDYSPRAVDVGHAVIDLCLPDDPSLLPHIAERFATTGATALIGEHVDDTDGLTPGGRAERLADEGIPSIVTLTGRNRSPAGHEREIDRLVAADVRAVHCVTGDHPAVRVSPDATASFTLDGTRLAHLARRRGAEVSVAESPAAPPVEVRAPRLALKQRAGADLAILNQAGSADGLIAFADRCRDAGADLALVAPVPVITDHGSAERLAQYPGLVLPAGLTRRVLDADDPRRAGIDAAVDLGRLLLDSGRFCAVNLSGTATDDGPLERAAMMCDIAAELAPT